MLKQNDWVKIEYGEYIGRYGKVVALNVNGSYKVLPYNEKQEPGSVADMDGAGLIPISPLVLDKDELKKFARAEKLYRDIADRVFPSFNIKAAENYRLSAEDIMAALENINKSTDCLNDFREWFWLIQNVFYENYEIAGRYKDNVFSDAPKTEDELFCTVYNLVENMYWKLEERYVTREDTEKFIVNFDDEPDWNEGMLFGIGLEETAYKAVCQDIISRVKTFIINKELPENEWQYSSSQKRHIIDMYEDEDLASASKEAKRQYKQFVKELYDQGDSHALKILAWSYFDGSPVYRQSFTQAEKYLLALHEKTGDPFAACALGHIYYGGLTGKKGPDYEKAFKYYNFGVLAGLDECICKVGDMLIYGRGTVKNLDMGMNLIVDGYRNALDRFCEGEYDNKFADYALRMGNICRDNLILGMGARDAYKFYLEAQYAVSKRTESDKSFEDEEMNKNIIAALENIRKEYRPDTDKCVLKADFPIYISHIFEDKLPVKVTICKEKSGYMLKMKRFRLIPGDEPKILVTYPELSYVNLTPELKFRLEDVNMIKMPEKGGDTFLSDGFAKNDNTNSLEFYSAGECIAAIDAKWYVIDVTKEKLLKKMKK